ncbi:hypothetical protein [Virgibacillus proomii]|jgi:hypothetical protein|uniref:hypothetical protein n=1 Tax=Virgibacillus proomii TaxID=84407 RepID=UPI0009868CCD|nr:hypothetical protein [Virgibacillus proomii]
MDYQQTRHFITSRLIEEGLLNNEMNQIIWDFAFENLTDKKVAVELEENTKMKLINEWIKWKKTYDQADDIKQKLILINELISIFDPLFNHANVEDHFALILACISREKKKSKLLSLNQQVVVFDEMEAFLNSIKTLQLFDISQTNSNKKKS